ncbi:MAG: hypothetical protein FVQ83_11705 [Chloroflexi bacterium]|nr:hypothetical protein [Chloroflexota bacterium]
MEKIMPPSSIENLRRANQIRLFLPFFLFLFVLFYETWEHILILGELKFDIHWTSEILFFGILGPAAVFGVLTYIIRLLSGQMDVSTELEVLNRTLEQKVNERTETLAERNADLALANEELKALDRLKSDFVSLVSHELRGPLTTLNGGLELALQDSSQIPAKSRRILDVMAQESQRLTNFVQTILDVSRLDAGILELNPGPVAVEPMLQRAADLVFASVKREIKWELPKEIPPIWADEIYMEKVVCNLLSNADKYSPPEAPIEIKVKMEGENLSILVTDYGPGIPTQMQDKIFKRFLRLESGDRVETQGWGLGLYFAKALTEAQDGKLSLQSPLDSNGEVKGSMFTINVPIAKEVPEDA